MKTNEKFKQEVFDLVGDEYIFLEEYKGCTTKILVKHNKKECNFYEYPVSPNSFLNGSRCPKCSKQYRKNTDDFKKEIYNKFGDEYKLHGEYKNANTKILIEHKCGYKWNIYPNNVFKLKTCPECKKKVLSNKFQMSYDEVKKFVENVDGYILLSKEYTNNRDYLLIQCPSHHIFKMKFNNFQQGQRCPECQESKGEKAISHYLYRNDIIFEPQYRIKECRDKLPLPFDFAIFKDKEKTKLNLLIEYDGEQHFRPLRRLNKEKGSEQLKKTCLHDLIKTKYCEDNDIKLIRIPYWEFKNIEKIVSSYFD